VSQPGYEINVNAVLDELDPLGRALFDVALERARVKRLTARVEELERQAAERNGAPQ
jgi:hypothetical protein